MVPPASTAGAGTGLGREWGAADCTGSHEVEPAADTDSAAAEQVAGPTADNSQDRRAHRSCSNTFPRAYDYCRGGHWSWGGAADCCWYGFCCGWIGC